MRYRIGRAGARRVSVCASERYKRDASRHRRSEAAALALYDEGAAGGTSGGGSDGVNHERIVLAGCPGGLDTGVEAHPPRRP